MSSFGGRHPAVPDRTWTYTELRSQLEAFERELRAAGLAETSIQTYFKGADAFLRWMTGDFTPQGPRH
jgi:hypothetical protein